jgi:hypothetical protein
MPSVQAGPRVYFAQAGEDGLIKIGYSTKIGQRLQALQVEAGRPVRMLGSVPGNTGVEMQWHDYFIDSNDHGEWFRPTAELVGAIREAAAADRTPAWVNVPYGSGRRSLRSERIRQARLREGKPIVMPGENVQIGTTIRDTQRTTLRTIAAATGTTVPAILRGLIEDYLEAARVAAEPREVPA